MRRVPQGPTTVVIAHRPQSANSADRIAVLHARTVSDSGTPDALLECGGRDAARWNAFE